MEPAKSSRNSLMTTSLKFNNFELTLSYSDTQLILQAVNLFTLKYFKAVITPDRVRELTSYIFPDLEALYLGLLDAFDRKDPTVDLVFNDKAQLDYAWKRTFRDKTKTETFRISLEEQEDDDPKALKSLMQKLMKRVAEQELRIEALEKENNRLKSDAERTVTERLENIERSLQLQGSLMYGIEFDPTSLATEGYLFVNSNKTIIRNKKAASRTVYARNSLAQSQKTKFNVRIDEISGEVIIGVCLGALKNKPSFWKSENAYCYCGHNEGRIYKSGTEVKLANSKVKVDSIVTVIVDLVSLIISFELDGRSISTTKIINPGEYYPFVQLYNQDNQVTLV